MMLKEKDILDALDSNEFSILSSVSRLIKVVGMIHPRPESFAPAREHIDELRFVYMDFLQSAKAHGFDIDHGDGE